jgi:hypothetical protein
MAIRQAALLGALLTEMRNGPRHAATFAIPPTIAERDGFGLCVGHLMSADATTLRYEVSGVLPWPYSDDVRVGSETEPKRRLLVELLQNLNRATPIAFASERRGAGIEHEPGAPKKRPHRSRDA